MNGREAFYRGETNLPKQMVASFPHYYRVYNLLFPPAR